MSEFNWQYFWAGILNRFQENFTEEEYERIGKVIDNWIDDYQDELGWYRDDGSVTSVKEEDE